MNEGQWTFDAKAHALGGIEDFAAGNLDDIISRHRAQLLGSWDEIRRMLDHATSPEQRLRIPDSFGGGWVFNWFCMDHLGFIENPRQRAMGIHQIHDFYAHMIAAQQVGDAVHWHFHPMSTYRQANRCASSYINSPELWDIIGRRLLDRKWFPVAHRAGFHDERPDSHWFLEQWIPFDLSNTATTDCDPHVNADLAEGRLGDWRWAPRDWSTYHPDHDNYQLPGHCRRKIGRCLNVLNRFANLTEVDLDAAFRRAADGKPTLVGLGSHDWRDLGREMDYVRFLLARVSTRYPTVKFKYAEAVEAFNAVHPAPQADSIKLKCTLSLRDGNRAGRVDIVTESGKVFGPQPFLAIRTRGRRIIHDNLNYGRDLSSFNYVFDDNSIAPDDVLEIGVAANDAAGNQSIHVISLDDAACAVDRHITF